MQILLCNTERKTTEEMLKRVLRDSAAWQRLKIEKYDCQDITMPRPREAIGLCVILAFFH